MAHEAGVPYFLHSCGNVTEIMDDLIDTVRIDAKHSVEDAILPVQEWKRRYGGRIGILGGVDIDKLTRLSHEALRTYVRKIIDDCSGGGHFAIGSGNSIPDYIPLENYLTMLDEALRQTALPAPHFNPFLGMKKVKGLRGRFPAHYWSEARPAAICPE